MPRIRTIKPEFPHDETLGRVSRDARFLFVLLWTCCDDYGRFRASAAYLRGQLYPYDDDLTSHDLETWLSELEQIGRIKSYRINADNYAVVTNWAKHQRVDNASRRVCPPPPWEAEDHADPPTRSVSRRRSRAESKPEEGKSISTSPTPAATVGDSPLDRDREGEGDREGDRDRDPFSSSTVSSTGPATSVEDDGATHRISSAVGVLAGRDLDASLARGNAVASRSAWLRAARARRMETDGERLAAIAKENPGWTGTRLADQISKLPAYREYITDGMGLTVLKRVDDA